MVFGLVMEVKPSNFAVFVLPLTILVDDDKFDNLERFLQGLFFLLNCRLGLLFRFLIAKSKLEGLAVTQVPARLRLLERFLDYPKAQLRGGLLVEAVLLEQFLPGVCLHLLELIQLLNQFLVFFFLLF